MIANEESEKQVSYKTRHKVYCEEMNFEQKKDTELEKDKFDDRAINLPSICQQESVQAR